jgi:hypothetical protein
VALRSAAYFALAGVAGSAAFYPAVLLAFFGLLPALLLVPLGFMAAGGIVGGKLDLNPEVVRSLAWAFALVGIGVLGSEIGAQASQFRTALVIGGGSLRGGFMTGGLAAAVQVSAGLRARAFLAFAVGGAAGASGFVIARTLLVGRGPLSVALGAVVGLGVAGALAEGRDARIRLDAQDTRE